MTGRKKLTLYISDEMVEETKREAMRQDRSRSWVMELAWKVARERLKTMPPQREGDRTP